jgi:hypothetical protein
LRTIATSKRKRPLMTKRLHTVSREVERMKRWVHAHGRPSRSSRRRLRSSFLAGAASVPLPK